MCACAAIALSLGLAPQASWAGEVAYPRSGLLDLSAQTYPVKRPRKITPLHTPESLDSQSAASPSGVRIQYGLLPLQRLLPEGYGSTRTRALRGASHAGIGLIDTMGPVATTGVDAWSLGARHWRYVSSLGYGITLGNTIAPAPSWLRDDDARLAGVGVYKVQQAGDQADPAWQYAVAAGVLDMNGDGRVASGGLDYGPLAYDVTSSYALGRNLSIASWVQGTQGLLALGLGGEYSPNRWGSWALGVSRAGQPGGGGWGYQLGYKLDLPYGWDASWTNEVRTAGHESLSSYHAAADCHCVGNQWQVGMPMGRWGTLSGTYEQWDRALGGLERQVGLAQDFWYGPFMSVSLQANRDLVSGDYGLGARFSVSLD